MISLKQDKLFKQKFDQMKIPLEMFIYLLNEDVLQKSFDNETDWELQIAAGERFVLGEDLGEICWLQVLISVKETNKELLIKFLTKIL